MEWAEAISEAVTYIESHITEDITMYEVAGYVNISHPNGTGDENYYTEIWLPVRQK